MRPMLKTAIRRSWRNRESVQFGVDPEHAVVLDPVDGAASGFLELLDGTRGLDLLTKEAEALGLTPQRTRRLLRLLTEGGVLDDATAHVGLAEAVRHRTAVLDRLRPDLEALSVVHPEPGGAAVRLRKRRSVRVRVDGAGRVGMVVASVLSAAGIGRIEVRDGGRVQPWEISPGGVSAEHLGVRREVAASRAVRRAAPDPRSGAVGRRGPAAAPEPRLGLVVLAPRDGLGAYAPDPYEALPLLSAGIPHLYTGVTEATGIVGPLVIPGQTACAGCLAARRADDDPSWPRQLAQLRSGKAFAVPACDVALATTVAGLAAAHALAFLDGGVPPSAGARVEIGLARLAPEVRGIPIDPRCVCGAGAEQGEGTMAG